MPEIKCPACWNEISSNDDICPFCGFVLNTRDVKVEIEPPKVDERQLEQPIFDSNKFAKKKKQDRTIITGSVAIVCLIIIFAWISSSGTSKNKDSYKYSSRDSTYSSSYATTGKEGAVNKAKSYLNSSAFSYTGLIEQLEYEGFSESEATYGADNCGANWNEQAKIKAKSYLSSSAFSEEGLEEQLIYEGFTEDEAIYGVDNCGADWYEQAVKKAASYLRSSSFSKSDLIDQLEYEGFSYDQAKYGVEQNGL